MITTLKEHRETLQNLAGQAAEELLSLAMLDTFGPSRSAAVDCIRGLPAGLWPTPETRRVARAIRSITARDGEVDLVTVFNELTRLKSRVDASYLLRVSCIAAERHVGSPGARVAAMEQWSAWQNRECLGDYFKDPAVTVDQLRELVAKTDFDSSLARHLCLTPSNILHAGPPPDSLFGGGPAPGVLAVLAGESGRSKSYVSCVWAAQLATGMTLHPAFGPRDRCPVVFFSYEDAPEVVRWRLDRIGAALPGFDLEIRDALKAGRLQFYCDLPEPMFANTDRLVAPTPLFGRIETLIRKHRPGLVVIDPFSGAAALRDENSSAEVSIVSAGLADLARQNRCVVLLVHHTAKSGADNVSQHSLRGSSALAGRARWIAQTTPHSNPDNVVLSVVKDSYHRAIGPVLLHRNESGVPLQVAPDRAATRNAADLIAKWLEDHPGSLVTEGGLRQRKGHAKDLHAALTAALPLMTANEVAAAIKDAVDRGLVRRVATVFPNGRKRELIVPATGSLT